MSKGIIICNVCNGKGSIETDAVKCFRDNCCNQCKESTTCGQCGGVGEYDIFEYKRKRLKRLRSEFKTFKKDLISQGFSKSEANNIIDKFIKEARK